MMDTVYVEVYSDVSRQLAAGSRGDWRSPWYGGTVEPAPSARRVWTAPHLWVVCSTRQRSPLWSLRSSPSWRTRAVAGSGASTSHVWGDPHAVPVGSVAGSDPRVLRQVSHALAVTLAPERRTEVDDEVAITGRIQDADLAFP